jgi:hypothetical protein
MSAALPARRQHLRHLPKRSGSRRQFKPPRLVLWIGLVLAALTVTALTAWLVVTSRFDPLPRIAVIDCQTSSTEPCPSHIQAVLNRFLSQPLLFSPLQAQLESAVLPEGYRLLSYTRVYPETLAVVVEPRPIGWAVVDAAGVPLAALALDSSKASTLSIQPSTPRATVLSTQLAAELSQRHAARAGSSLHCSSCSSYGNTAAPAITRVTIYSPFDITLSLEGQPFTYRLNPQELVLNLNRLSFILKSDLATTEASESGEVDVRFRVPVLRSAP